MNPWLSLKKKIDAVIVQQLTQGLSPDRIALTIAVGLCIAIIPIVGVTTILSFAAAWALGLNQPVIQTINWSSYALQLLLIFPFIRFGEWIFRAPRLGLSLDQMVAFVKADPWGALVALSTTFGHAVVAWLLVIPFVGALAFFAARPILRALTFRLRLAAARAKPDGSDGS
ncbi:MAG TPA: DUF2062 domain-containing protein [Thermoanaerobaculia bacterium]|jgi:uncharacterized protein (DUF2062 family)